jgi:hypothetical protein
MRASALLLSSLAVLTSAACGTGNDKDSGQTPLKDSSAPDEGLGSDIGLDDVTMTDAACASSTFVAEQAPASLIFVLDGSESMNDSGKWSAAALAIVSAVDQDSFDTMSLGLLVSPNGMVTGPSCVFGIPVACGSPALPQIAIKPAGKDKSSGTTGVRKQMYDWLASNSPKAGYDGTPLYEALKTSYSYLRLSSAKSKLLAVVITDGTASCASLSTRGGYKDINGCNDWEYPAALGKLIKDAHDDTTAPIYTFVVGVPGADTTGKDPNKEPPYSARKALSSYAKAGAPEYVASDCNGDFSAPETADPAKPCHFDMTTGTFDAKTLASNIAKVRGAALGCIYELPKPAMGTVDKGKVNVRIDESGGAKTDLKRRSDPKDACATDGCWDYTADDKIELVGKACEEAKALTDGKVTIVVGCATVLK